MLGTVLSTFRYGKAFATDYYVSGSGNDGNNGLSTDTAFRNIQTAADLTKPGDTVYVMNGLYTNLWPTGDVVTVTHDGSPLAWITYKAYPGHSPKLQFNGWNGFNLSSAAYIEINGFVIEGNNNNVTLDYAKSQANNLDNPLTAGNGIFANPTGNTFSHHINILNNRVYNCGTQGISFAHSDYITIQNNILYKNGWYGPGAGSGISLYQSRNFDKNTGYKMYVMNNISDGNSNYIPFHSTESITDGNGIIIDDSKNTQGNSPFEPYNGRTLVANNIVFNNGGSGIHSFYSEHVDIINNTAYMNSQSSAINNGEIYAMASADVNIMNNILYSTPGKRINNKWQDSNLTYDYNIYFNSTDIPVVGVHDLQTDPKFVNPDTDSAIADFHLQSTSPAINSATANLAPKNDDAGHSRLCGSYDRGAYEFTRCEQTKWTSKQFKIQNPKFKKNNF